MSQEDCTIVEQDNQQEKSKAVDVVKDVSTALPSNLKEQIAPSSIGGLDAASAGKAPPSLSSSNNALQQIASRRQQQQQQQRAHPPASSSLETPDINWSSTTYFPSTPQLTFSSSKGPTASSALPKASDKKSDNGEEQDYTALDLQISHGEETSAAVPDYDPESIDSYDNVEAILSTAQSLSKTADEDDRGVDASQESLDDLDNFQDSLPSVQQLSNPSPQYSSSHQSGQTTSGDASYFTTQDDYEALLPLSTSTDHEAWSYPDNSMQYSFDDNMFFFPDSNQSSSDNRQYSIINETIPEEAEEEEEEPMDVDLPREQTDDSTGAQLGKQDSPPDLPLLTLGNLKKQDDSSTQQQYEQSEWQMHQETAFGGENNTQSQETGSVDYSEAFSAQVEHRNQMAHSSGFLDRAAVEAFNQQAHLQERRDQSSEMDLDNPTNQAAYSQLEQIAADLQRHNYNYNTEGYDVQAGPSTRRADIPVDSPASGSKSSSSGGSALTTSAAKQTASERRRLKKATHICPVEGCGSTFTRKFNLEGHLRAHTGYKPYQCSEPGCDKSFARSYDLKRHEGLHGGVKAYKCENCPKSFARPDALARHMRSDLGHGGACRDAALQEEDEEEEEEGVEREAEEDDDAASQVSTALSTAATATGSIREGSPDASSSSQTASQRQRQTTAAGGTSSSSASTDASPPQQQTPSDPNKAMRRKMAFKGFPL